MSPAFLPECPVLGVDACRAGWAGVLWRPDGSLAVLVEPRIDVVFAAATTAGERPAVVGIDIPIGLPDSGRRGTDAAARAALPGKGSSVFPTLVRAAYEAASYAEGRAAMLAATAGEPDGPRSCSAQAWQLGRKVLEVDAWARAGDPGTRVVEVHPEVSFATMAGAPLLESKKSPAGVVARRAALASRGLAGLPARAPRGAGLDDVLDAAAVAWTARRVLAGEARRLPDPPEVFSDGWPACIHA